MRGLRYILTLLFLLCYRGLSAQEFDLYDFRYYKRFDTIEELLAPEADTTRVAKLVLDRKFTTRALDYNLSAIRFARRGRAYYRDKILLNDLEIPFIRHASIRSLQLLEEHSADEKRLTIDTLRDSSTSLGISFTSGNMPYSMRFTTAQKCGKGWNLSTSLAARTGRDLHIEGLFGNSLEFNAVATKSWNSAHLLSLAVFAKPQMRSTRLASTAEAFRLTDNNLYNPAWGYQNGKLRNARIRREFLPTAFLGYEGEISERTRFNSAIALTAGVERYSSLDWFDAQTPSPDNYRYMPSYFGDEEDIFLAVESEWLANNPRYTQIDFDRLITTNRLHNGEATYAISDRVTRTIFATFKGLFSTKLNSGAISYGVEATTANYRNYKQMRDLLGADYIVDLDYFLIDDDTYGNSLQNNLDEPNRRIVENERFGYDYAFRKHNISAVFVYNYSTTRLNLDIAAKFGYSDISRRGFYRKELFAENSLGESRHLKFSPYAMRIKAGYLVAENHFLESIITTEASPCEEENLFLQSQYNNRTIDNPSLRSGYNGEIRYTFQKPNLKVGTTLFISTELNDTQVRQLYDDLSGEYADIVASRINTLCYGLEVEAEYRFADHFRTTAALTAGRYKYLSNARITAYSDSSNIRLIDNVESLCRNLSLGNAPQIALTAALAYYNRGWYAQINANYAGLRYAEPSLVMRTERVLSVATSPEERESMLRQERLRDAFTLDISLSKSLYLERLDTRVYRTKAAPRFTDKHPRSKLVFSIGIRNLLGSRNMVYSAREASRLQRYSLADGYIYSRQATRYLYAYPRTYQASISFRF